MLIGPTAEETAKSGTLYAELLGFRHPATVGLARLHVRQLDGSARVVPDRDETVYYWFGGTERGEWREALPGVWPHRHTVGELIEQLTRAGYVAVRGSRNVGAPEGPPVERLKVLARPPIR